MLVVDGLSKSYGAISALSDVSVSVEAGEVLALVGENGAGKSTLVRCMARAETQDSGSVRVDGVEVGRTPRAAIEQGISVVWQDLALCENLDVAANLFLGREIASVDPATVSERPTLHNVYFRRYVGLIEESTLCLLYTSDAADE